MQFMCLIRPSWQHSPITLCVRYITHTSQQVFAERGAFHPVSKRIASFHTFATRSKQTLVCPTLHILRPCCVTSNHQSVKATHLGLRITGILPNSCPLLWTICRFIQTGPVSRPDCAFVHLDGQTFSYHGISYHSICIMGDQPFYAKEPRPLL